MKETREELIKFKNLPKKIFLIVGDDFGIEREVDFKELSEVTWCEDRQYPDDIEYVLASHPEGQFKCKMCKDEHWIVTHEGRVSEPCPSCGGGERYKEQEKQTAEDNPCNGCHSLGSEYCAQSCDKDENYEKSIKSLGDNWDKLKEYASQEHPPDVKKFSNRPDQIFEQGNPTKAQIIDAFNKFSGEKHIPTDEERLKHHFMAEEYFLEHWIIQGTLDNEFSKTLKRMQERIEWLKEQIK